MTGSKPKLGGVAGWLLARFHREACGQPSLVLLERITLAPRQSLALIEADGHKLLVAIPPEGAPAFYALDCKARPCASSAARKRVSW